MFTLPPAFAAALCALALLLAPHAHAATLVKTEHVDADLVADKASVQPGKPVLVGLRLRMAPAWHTYWKNPGDSGLPTRIQWVLPEGWKAGEIQWLYPQPLPVGPLMNYGYEDEVVLLAELTPPANAPQGNAAIKARAEWLVCKDVCVPEKGEIDFILPVGSATPADDPRFVGSIERARRMLPVDLSGWKYEAARIGKSLVVRLTPPAGTALPANVMFFPERENLIEPAAREKVTREGSSLRIEMALADPPIAGLASMKGVAVADGGWAGSGAAKAINFEAPLGTSLAAVAGTSAQDNAASGSLFAALAFAFLGGILLNLMPCVFPVLGIKVLGFVEHAHGDARAMRLQGIVFFVGVVVSFLALAAIMLGMRAAGTQLGWGFQLQSPGVVALLAALFFVLALNLSGVFEWGAFAQSVGARLSAKGRYADAFLSGALATVVATPCTAPFMGAAVGFTLTQDATLALAIFATLGAGMALPVLLLSLFPALLKRLPRPGAWMEVFKQVLAFPLYATVAWLAWVLGAQAGNDAVFALLAGLVLIAMAAWIYGRSLQAEGAWRPALAVILAAAGLVVAWPGATAPADNGTASAQDLQWQPWSPERVRELTAAGHPVFVDFTAAWCVTCQVNKRVALHNATVVASFAAHDVVTLKADWTRQDPRITATLAALGRNAVPVYALYLPGEDAPHLLPEVLTPALVLGEIDKIPAAKAATAVGKSPAPVVSDGKG